MLSISFESARLVFEGDDATYTVPVGVDTLAFSSVGSAARLRVLDPGFASGALKPFPIDPGAVYPLEDAAAAYRAVAGSARERIILAPKA